MNAKIYNGNVQPNPKEFKIWVNDEGVIKTWNGIKWVEATAGEENVGSIEKPAYIGFEIWQPSLGDGNYYRYSKDATSGDTWEKFLMNDTYPAYGYLFSSDENNNVTYEGNILCHDIEVDGWLAHPINPVKTTDIVESKLYYLEGGGSGF